MADVPLTEVFIKNVQSLRKSMKLQVKDLAEKADMKPPQLHKYLSGKTVPTLPIVERIARALHTTPMVLLDTKRPPPPGPVVLPPHTPEQCVSEAIKALDRLDPETVKPFAKKFFLRYFEKG